MQYMKDDKWVSDGWQCIDHPSFMTARSIGFDFYHCQYVELLCSQKSVKEDRCD